MFWLCVGWSVAALMNVSTSCCLAEDVGSDPSDPVVVSGSCGAVTLVEGEDVERCLQGFE